jgi:hypothetical protein
MADDNPVKFLAILLVATFATGVFVWVVNSTFEASAFNDITGSNVSTWDAMFIELRVQEPVKP